MLATIRFITIIALLMLFPLYNSIAASADDSQDEIRGVSSGNQQVVLGSKSDFACKIPEDEVAEKPIAQKNIVFYENYENKVNACYPGQEVDHRAAYENGESDTADQRTDNNGLDPETSPVPNPNISSFESRFLRFDNFAQEQTTFYAGALPFLALPDSNLESTDNVFDMDSFSFFLYFKRKF